eukprot:12425579-Karenia_brevis.AAC.1
MMGSKSENIKIAKGLLQRRLVRIWERDELLWVGKKDQRRPLLNGWFGVSRGTQLESDKTKDVVRLIMNLTASNSAQKAWPGDIGTLPYVGKWKQIVLPDGQVLLWSWEDLKGAFCLVGLSGGWSP